MNENLLSLQLQPKQRSFMVHGFYTQEVTGQ